jgi:DNA-binding transcriptional LysR family regulator
VTLADLAPHDLVLLDVPPSGDYFRGIFAAAGLEPRVRHRASSIELVRSLVARDQGYGLLGSRPATAVSWEGRPLRDVELDGDVEPVRFSLAWLAGTRRTARARAFAALCHEQVG